MPTLPPGDAEPDAGSGPGTGGGPPPGWYVDPDGASRWWDGQAWGSSTRSGGPTGAGVQPAAWPPGSGYPGPYPGHYGVAAPATPSKGAAAVSHIGAFSLGFVLPLILLLTAGKDDAYTRHHAAEALNFQISVTVIALATYIPIIGFAFASSGTRSAAPPAGFFVAFAVFGIVILSNYVFSVMGIVAAAQGKWYRYPVTIRFVRGPFRKGDEPPQLP